MKKWIVKVVSFLTVLAIVFSTAGIKEADAGASVSKKLNIIVQDSKGNPVPSKSVKVTYKNNSNGTSEQTRTTDKEGKCTYDVKLKEGSCKLEFTIDGQSINGPDINGKKYNGELITVTYDADPCANGHDWSAWTTVDEATCVKAGKEEHHCKRTNCTAKETRNIQINPNGHSTTPVVVHPTCTVAGYTYDKCVLCNKQIGEKYNTTNAIGHNWTVTWVWDGVTSATAYFTCKNDSSHKDSLTDSNPVAKVVNGASCTGTGSMKYTATVKFEGKEYSDSKTDVINASGHKWDLSTITWEWDANFDIASAKATVKCGNEGCTQTHTVDATVEVIGERVPATCEADGRVEYKATVVIDNETRTATKTVTADSIGHDWNLGDVTFDWSEDYSAATVSIYCNHDKNHELNFEADVDSKTDVATCTETGLITYTATYKYDEAHNLRDVQTVVLPIDPENHNYNDTPDKVVNPTCEEDGYELYLCTRCQHEKKVVLSKTGHDWNLNDVTFDWSEDYSAATVSIHCNNDSNHTQEFAADVVSKTDVATCTETGLITYTATYKYDETHSYSDVQTVVLPIDPENHNYNDTPDEVVNPTCEEDGYELYLCTRCQHGKKVVLPATGHAWDGRSIVWNWNGYTAATATFTCLNDAEHSITLPADVTSHDARIPSTTNEGLRVYTATVVLDQITYTDFKNEYLPMLDQPEEPTPEEPVPTNEPEEPVPTNAPEEPVPTNAPEEPVPTNAPEEEVEPEEIDLDDVVVPEGAPEEEEVENEEELDLDDVVVPEGAPEEEVEVDGVEVPASDAALPQTGLASSAVFYGIGALVAALGGFTAVKSRRKENEE